MFKKRACQQLKKTASNPKIKIDLRIALISSAIFIFVGCQTAPKNLDGNIRFFGGKALIYDKLKQKQDWVNFTASVSSPEKLRIDAYLGLLGLPLGTLIINDEKAIFVNIIEKKVYKTARGSEVLEKLLKTPIAAGDVIAVFAEKFPLRNSWVCESAPMSQKCKQGDLLVDWSRTPEDDKSMLIDGPKAKINFAYTQRANGKTDFEVKEPKGYEVIQL